MSKNVVTLKSGSKVTQGHWKLYHAIERTWFPISACEALPFTKSDIYRLDNLIARSLCRIFNVHTRENIDRLRHYLNVPCLPVVFESRKQRFMDKLIDLDHFSPILRSGRTRGLIHHTKRDIVGVACRTCLGDIKFQKNIYKFHRIFTKCPPMTVW